MLHPAASQFDVFFTHTHTHIYIYHSDICTSLGHTVSRKERDKPGVNASFSSSAGNVPSVSSRKSQMGQMGLTLGQIGLAARPTSATVQASSQLSSFFHRKSQTISTIGTPLEGPTGRHISNSDILRFDRVFFVCIHFQASVQLPLRFSRSLYLGFPGRTLPKLT